MINPTDKDIGRKVMWVVGSGSRFMCGDAPDTWEGRVYFGEIWRVEPGTDGGYVCIQVGNGNGAWKRGDSAFNDSVSADCASCDWADDL